MQRSLAVWLVLVLGTPAFAQDLVLINGTIIDGTGNPRVAGNVRIHDGEVTGIGLFKPAAGDAAIDVKGMIVAPGFIDIHSSSAARVQLLNGVTTAVLGQDGEGPVAIEEYMKPLDRDPIPMNVAAFTGHGKVRKFTMGDDFKRAATPDEVKKMANDVEAAMREGAFGLSAGLDREPGSYAATEELIALAKVAGKYGGIFVTTLRNRTDKVLDAVKEAIEIGRRAKVPVHISGLTGPPLRILPLIDQARLQGVDVTADVSSDEKAVREFLRNRWVMAAGEVTFPLTPNPALTQESAIRKMSALPASRLSFKQRGILKKGSAADIVVFDPKTPGQMKYVFVNGELVVKEGLPTEAKPGRALR